MSASRIFRLVLATSVALLALGGCATLPGDVNVSKSEFDGSTHVTQAPGWAGGMKQVKFGLSWNTKMAPDAVRLDAMVADTGDIATGESLHFNIDGHVVSLASYDEKTTVEGHAPYVSRTLVVPGSVWSGKSYDIPVSTIEQILKASRVAWRIDLSKDYLEGVLDLGQYPTTASGGFQNFLQALQTVQTGQVPSPAPNDPQPR